MEKHHLYWIIGAIVFYLWWQGALASFGLPSAWVLNGGKNV